MYKSSLFCAFLGIVTASKITLADAQKCSRAECFGNNAYSTRFQAFVGGITDYGLMRVDAAEREQNQC